MTVGAPDIWLQGDEANKPGACGCILSAQGPAAESGAALYFCPLHSAAGALLKACQAQRRAIDLLFAQLILKDATFKPSASGQPWEALQAANKAIDRAAPPEVRAPDWFA